MTRIVKPAGAQVFAALLFFVAVLADHDPKEKKNTQHYKYPARVKIISPPVIPQNFSGKYGNYTKQHHYCPNGSGEPAQYFQ